MPSPLRGMRPPPPGVTPNFDNPENQDAENIALHTTMLFLSTCALGIRLYTRTHITRQLGLDDYLCVIGFIFICAYSGLLLAATLCGFIGYHIWEVLPVNYAKGSRFELYARFMYYCAAGFVKLSCLVFYRRFLTPNAKARHACYAGMTFLISGYLAFLLLSIFSCTPVAKRFNPSIPGHCVNANIAAYGSGVLNIVTDCFVLIFPLPIIWGLRMKLARKTKVMAVFLMGLVVVAMSITRTVLTSIVFRKSDPTWELSHFDIYPVLELNFGLICACCLTFPAFLDRYGPRFFRNINFKDSPRQGMSQQSRSPYANSPISSIASNRNHDTQVGRAKDTGTATETEYATSELHSWDNKMRQTSMDSSLTLQNHDRGETSKPMV